MSEIVAHVRILLDEVERLTYERDQYRAESQRLGNQAQHLVNRVTAERERANEAARLSAAARDANDDLLKQVEAAHEKVGIVEEGRLDLIVENRRLEHERDQARAELAAMEQDRDRLSEELAAADPVLDAVKDYVAMFNGDFSKTSGSVLQLLTAWTEYERRAPVESEPCPDHGKAVSADDAIDPAAPPIGAVLHALGDIVLEPEPAGAYRSSTCPYCFAPDSTPEHRERCQP